MVPFGFTTRPVPLALLTFKRLDCVESSLVVLLTVLVVRAPVPPIIVTVFFVITLDFVIVDFIICVVVLSSIALSVAFSLFRSRNNGDELFFEFVSELLFLIRSVLSLRWFDSSN